MVVHGRVIDCLILIFRVPKVSLRMLLILCCNPKGRTHNQALSRAWKESWVPSFDLIRAFDSFRRQLERPGQNHRDGKAKHDRHHDDLHHPCRRFEGRQKNRRRLNQQPRRHSIDDRNLVNVAPLQLGEKRFHVTGRSLYPNRTRNPFRRVDGSRRAILSHANTPGSRNALTSP
jgi:hypothetical protein